MTVKVCLVGHMFPERGGYILLTVEAKISTVYLCLLVILELCLLLKLVNCSGLENQENVENKKLWGEIKMTKKKNS